MHRFLSLLLAAGFAAAVAHADVKIAPDDPKIEYMGRTALDDGRMQMGFPGVTIRFAYRGPAPVIEMSAANANGFFNLACNGWEPVLIRLKEGANQIALPTGMAPAAGWIVELVRRTESWMGTASFDGLLLPAGCELVPLPARPDRRILFIGDSILCGEYNERFPPENDDSPRTTNAARSYGMLLGRWLDAQVHLVGYGGRGITRDWAGRTEPASTPVFFERALPDSPGSSWDHSRYVPDVVVIDVGTDLDADLPDATRFAEAYGQFVSRVRAVHPGAFILLCESGYQTDGSDGRPRTERDLLWRTLQTVIEQRREAGDTRLRAVRMGYHPGTPTNTHLVAFQQEQLATNLLGAIREVTGW